MGVGNNGTLDTRKQPRGAPTWRNRARYRSESMFPELWDGMEGYWLTTMGRTGLTLKNLSPHGSERDGTFGGSLTAAAWIPMGGDGRPSIEMLNQTSSPRIQVGNWDHDTQRDEITMVAYVRTDFPWGGASDARIMARQKSTSEANHRWMLSSTSGGSDAPSGAGSRFMRTRFKIGGSVVTTAETTGVGALHTGETQIIAATYDGANIRIWHNEETSLTVSQTGALDVTGDSTFENELGSGKGGTAPWDGHFLMWGLFSRALTARHFQILKAFPDAPFWRRPRLVVGFPPVAAPAAVLPPNSLALAGAGI